jgi:hypothetical protein
VRLRCALALLALGLAACSGGGYNASGTWEGVATNQRYPYDAVTVRFILRDQGGVLSGSHYALLDAGWTYVGEVRGTRSGQEASWRVDAPSGYILVEGAFQGEAFRGTYTVAVYGSGSLTAALFLSRARVQNLGFSHRKGPLAQQMVALLEEGQ